MIKIAVIGQGYVGLPLALEFSKFFPVIGYDINEERISELKQGVDYTCESDNETLLLNIDNYLTSNSSIGYYPSYNKEDIKSANLYIVTVPTPIDEFKAPDLEPLRQATKLVGEMISEGDIVVFESTVYPGCTEEFCVPILERISGLQFNKSFYVGYSPERIVPGDKIHTLDKIVKITSGSTPEVADKIDALYSNIITAGTHKVSSIKVAEAAKAIENAQRDVNISFVNELALIFDRIGIDTNEVLDAASTKFNFLKFKPGLVGGHCISVDPYYLTYKALQLGYHPNVILSGRRVNDLMPSFIASKVIKLMITKGINIKNANVLILGFTFKEHCPDTRNTKVYQLHQEMKEFGCKISIFDPWASVKKVKEEYNIELLSDLDSSKKYEAIIIAVAHNEFLEINLDSIKAECSVVYDVKSFYKKSLVDSRL